VIVAEVAVLAEQVVAVRVELVAADADNNIV
jgi:hypothetical protein